jgi:hypothetical protein
VTFFLRKLDLSDIVLDLPGISTTSHETGEFFFCVGGELAYGLVGDDIVKFSW